MIEGVKCPRCGKEHYPTPDHVYRDSKGMYCGWHCFNHRYDDELERKVEMVNSEGEVVRTFNSIAEAIAQVRGQAFRVIRAIAQKEEYRNYFWRYKK